MDFTDWIDLAAERLGGAVLFANDEFFAPKENLLKPGAPIFIEGKYTDQGKWMDGWETRRRRTPGFDWCIIRLGLPGIVHGVVVDTRHFKGNYPESCSIEACAVEGTPDVDQLAGPETEWVEILSRSPLQGDAQNPFPIQHRQRFTHLRFKIYPDGGVARLRVYGEVVPDWKQISRLGGAVDLAAVENGGLVIASSDMFFGHRHNLIMPGRAASMSDGWETRRRRGPGHDWVVIKLGAPGVIQRVEVDTSYFKGNYPESCSLEGCRASGAAVDEAAIRSWPWVELLPRTRLQAHTRHFYEEEIRNVGAVSYVRFNIFPDGGVSRLRLFGRIGENGLDEGSSTF
jgi:allantoicase